MLFACATKHSSEIKAHTSDIMRNTRFSNWLQREMHSFEKLSHNKLLGKTLTPLFQAVTFKVLSTLIQNFILGPEFSSSDSSYKNTKFVLLSTVAGI